MPKPLSERERQEFLAGRHVAVLSVARDDGRPPLITPIWYAYTPGGNIVFYTGVTSRKAALLQKYGVLSLTVQQEELPYKYVTVEGRVVDTIQPPTEELIVAVASRYLPEALARQLAATEAQQHANDLIAFTIKPERWGSADFTDDFNAGAPG